MFCLFFFSFLKFQVRCVEVFKEYYHSKAQQRKLSWIYSLGNCNISGRFDSKTIELIVSTYQVIYFINYYPWVEIFYRVCESWISIIFIFQASVLLLFNNSDRLSFSEIMDQSNLGHDDLVRVLLSLSCAKYKILNKEPNTKTISPTDYFEFNSKFTDRMRRIKVWNHLRDPTLQSIFLNCLIWL